MNALNPQYVRDQERYEKLTTAFAREKFWKIRYGIGDKHWTRLMGTIERNLCGGQAKKTCSNAFSIVAIIRKNEAQRAWRKQRETLAELREHALQDLAITQQTAPQKITEKDLFHPGDNILQFRPKVR